MAAVEHLRLQNPGLRMNLFLGTTLSLTPWTGSCVLTQPQRDLAQGTMRPCGSAGDRHMVALQQLTA